MRNHYALPSLLLACAACAGSTATSDSGSAPDATAAADAGETPRDAGEAPRDAGEPPVDAGPEPCAVADGTVVNLTTDDGETLEADLYSTGVKGAPAAVLLHMIPPNNTRANYPRGFIDALTTRGINVINVDRRGAGGSTGTARDAYTGPNGKWDPKAAVDFLVAHECAIDPSKIAVIGASNGTTSAFDYAVYAAGEASAPNPAALVFLTGGGYTETNNRINAQRPVLDPLPVQFVFSTAERAWSAGVQPVAAPGWVFEELDPGDHGTRMFDRRPESIETVADFVQTSLQ